MTIPSSSKPTAFIANGRSHLCLQNSVSDEKHAVQHHACTQLQDCCHITSKRTVPDAVELLDTEDWAQIIGDLLQTLLVLLVNH